MLSFTGTVDKIKQQLFLLDKDKKYDVEIKQHREKRSLNSNSYAWALITQIADILNTDKDSIYLMMLKRYGVSYLVPISNEVPVNDFTKYTEIECRTDKYTWYKIYKGSSQYDAKEMSVFLNGIVSECKEMGIPTKEELEIQRMIDYWEKQYL